MNPTRNALAALLHAALLAAAFLPQARAEVIPIIITNIVVQKIGPEAELEPLEEGLLYWRPADATTEAGLYYADGETPGGVAVCVGKADYHHLTNDLACNGHAIELNSHYTLRAEGDSCLLRYGTNIVLRVDGNLEAGSTNSLIKATVLAIDNDGLTIQANALAADGATIEVTTDLLAVEAWSTATNAAVIESTDVTTTWRITYLDEPYQFYRVFAGSSAPHGTGITAERPLTAAQGLTIPAGQPLTMGTNTWTDLPDMSAYAPSSAVASVRADLNSLSWRTTTNETAIDANAAAIAANSTRIDAIESAYVHSSDIADFATNGAVASVERRVTQLQNDTCTLFWAATNGGLKSDQTSYLLPTNFPTPKLVLYVFQMPASNIAIDIPAWNPGRNVQIDVIAPRVPRSSDNALNFLLIGNPVYTHSSYAGVYFRYSYSLDAGRWFTASWTMSSATTATGNAAPDGTQYTTDGTYLADAPATVEAWIALHPEWADEYTPAPAMMGPPSLQSLRPSLSSSAPLALGADLDAPDAIDAFDPEDFPIDDFTDDPAALDDLAPEDFPEDLDDFADAPDDAPDAEE